MTTKEALQVIDEATQPINVGKISRAGYQAIEAALVTIKSALEPIPVKDAKVKVLPPK